MYFLIRVRYEIRTNLLVSNPSWSNANRSICALKCARPGKNWVSRNCKFHRVPFLIWRAIQLGCWIDYATQTSRIEQHDNKLLHKLNFNPSLPRLDTFSWPGCLSLPCIHLGRLDRDVQRKYFTSLGPNFILLVPCKSASTRITAISIRNAGLLIRSRPDLFRSQAESVLPYRNFFGLNR